MPEDSPVHEAAARLLAVHAALRDGPCSALRAPLPTIEQLLPDAWLPRDAATAYAIQDALIRARGPVGGWKVAGSGPAGPSCAPVFREVLHAGPAELPWQIDASTEFECEIAFEFGRDMPPQARPYEAAEVAAAISATRVTIELLAPRFRASGTPLDRWIGIAEGQSCGALVVSAQGTAGFADVDCARQPVRIEMDGKTVHEAIGGNALPRLLPVVTWLANHLTQRGLALSAGQIVTTGSCTGKRPWDGARQVRVLFENIGELVATRPVQQVLDASP